jgi:hypothetical protein
MRAQLVEHAVIREFDARSAIRRWMFEPRRTFGGSCAIPSSPTYRPHTTAAAHLLRRAPSSVTTAIAKAPQHTANISPLRRISPALRAPRGSIDLMRRNNGAPTFSMLMLV